MLFNLKKKNKKIPKNSESIIYTKSSSNLSSRGITGARKRKIFQKQRAIFPLFLMNLPQELLTFYHIWPWHQWLMSLISLIFLYWITGHFYNKWLSDRGGWLSFKMRVWLIISDLTINLALGLYYIHYRETLMGAIMLKCPIAISPVIFLLEMICVYVYYRFWKKKL